MPSEEDRRLEQLQYEQYLERQEELEMLELHAYEEYLKDQQKEHKNE
jgi:hypothetical protein